jgi:hypothetical protein
VYKTAEALDGSGFYGLLPATRLRGNHEPKLPEASRELTEAIIHEDYGTLKQRASSLRGLPFSLRAEIVA